MPSYQFDPFTGRLKNSEKLQPLYPIKPLPNQRADPPKMIWDTIKNKAAKTEVPQRASGSTIPPRLAAKMVKFQADMTKPVYLMGGTPDKVLFGLTTALGVYCAVLSFQFLAQNYYKK